MRTLVLLAFLASPVLASSYAWWVTERYVPSSQSFRGLPVTSLTTPLVLISLFSCSDGNEFFSKEQCDEVRLNDARFEVEGDFNSDGTTEIAQTGVGQRADGSMVGVIIISEKKNPARNQVLVFSANSFRIVDIRGGRLTESPCMECDAGAFISWDATKRQYVLGSFPQYG